MVGWSVRFDFYSGCRGRGEGEGYALGGSVSVGGGLRHALLDVVHCDSWACCFFSWLMSCLRGCRVQCCERDWSRVAQSLTEMCHRVSRGGCPDKAAIASGCFGVLLVRDPTALFRPIQQKVETGVRSAWAAIAIKCAHEPCPAPLLQGLE